MAEEQLKRFGTAAESAERLADQAAAAEKFLGIHGVSTTARDTNARPGSHPGRRSKSTSPSTTLRRVETGCTGR
jgi:hypothetical protein